MILKEFKNKICTDLELDEYLLSRNESDIISICADIIDTQQNEIKDLEKDLIKKSIEIKNLKIQIEDLMK
jgi:hypothetical protein